ncbi:tRNA glutamyl-Q(34) synthetase GluQRS [Roseovarius sp.]|uniref:tRNA glutamyl-Q(34) synthetase GluQRS n=1 Tax=Roseovarius sp. TaxID=1486281 RepID=UPI0035192DBB
MTYITRFAPSPTGPLHLGHAYSAIVAHDMARAAQGRFLLRIEDIDQTRARPEWESQILDDLSWLGLTWDDTPLRQSDRLPRYAEALDRLWDAGLLSPCSCRRRDIAAAASAPQEGAPLHGPDGIIYPGTCRDAPRKGPRPSDEALRLDMRKAAQTLVTYHELLDDTRSTLNPEEMVTTIGDIVLSRRDFLGSYHLSVVLDDADQEITHVIRGADLAEATPIHVLLQRLLGLPTPRYHHHRLIRDEAGKRLAKRDDARAIATYRAAGDTPADIRRRVGL